MPYDPEKHDRRSIRLDGYDYAQPGGYFVTLCVQDRVCLFGNVVDGRMRLNRFGQVVAGRWRWLEQRYAHVRHDAWVVMPNHLHGIVVLTGGDANRGGNGGRRSSRGGSRTAPTTTVNKPTPDEPTPDEPAPAKSSKRKPLGRLIGAFKTVSTKRMNQMRDTPGERIWQRNFYERIVRDAREHARIRQYIRDNPRRWNADRYRPSS